jgi:hypothetical protein
MKRQISGEGSTENCKLRELGGRLCARTAVLAAQVGGYIDVARLHVALTSDKLTGGERGIRTPDTRKGIHAFEARAFSHSAISPRHLVDSMHFHFIREAVSRISTRSNLRS